MKIQVYKSRFTGKLFEDKNEFIQHLLALRKDMKEERKDKRLRLEFKDWLNAEKKKITNVDMIVPWILENQQKLMKACNLLHHISFGHKFYSSDEFTKIELDVRYSNSVSNTHRCPHNGVTNWGGDSMLKDGSPAPRGYPGFAGNMNAVLKRNKKHNSEYPISDLLNFLQLHTGSGSGGNERCSYGISIFIEDWPGLRQQVYETECDVMVYKLTGRR